MLETLEPTSIDAMPASGSATYSGVMGFSASEEAPVDVYSKASLTANFGAATISGSLTDFQHYDLRYFPGTVEIQGGVITGNEFAADVSGSLLVDGTDASVEGDLFGIFGGAEADMAVSVIYATLGGTQDLYGYLIAAQ